MDLLDDGRDVLREPLGALGGARYPGYSRFGQVAPVAEHSPLPFPDCSPARADWDGDGWRRHEWHEQQERRWREHEWREHEWRERQRQSYYTAPPVIYSAPPPAYPYAPPPPPPIYQNPGVSIGFGFGFGFR